MAIAAPWLILVAVSKFISSGTLRQNISKAFRSKIRTSVLNSIRIIDGVWDQHSRFNAVDRACSLGSWLCPGCGSHKRALDGFAGAPFLHVRIHP